MNAPKKTAPSNSRARQWSHAPWIVRYERVVSYLWCSAAAILLVAFVAVAAHASAKYASTDRLLILLFACVLVLNWWLAGAIRRGTRAAWYVHLLTALLGAETVIQRLVTHQPFISADMPLCVELVLLVVWIRPDVRAWFGIGTMESTNDRSTG